MSLLRFLKRKLEDWLFPLRMYFGRKIMYDQRRMIVQVSSTELIKGPCSEQELEAMQYVGQHTDVSIPKVHRTYRRRNGLFIAMEFIRGQGLDHVWSGLTADERKMTARRVWLQLRSLRSATPFQQSDLAVGSVRGGSVFEPAVSQGPIGPFKTLEEFHTLLRDKNPPAPEMESFAHFWTQDGSDVRWHSVLTHADLAPRNIICSEDGSFTIIDWEYAGLWPEYWECVKWHFADLPHLPGWSDIMDEVSGRDHASI
jgi:aminoglycoside phosphotransferase (APT) family kinase protein